MADLYKAEPQVGKPGHCFCAQVFGPKPERKDILTVEPTEDPAEATRIAKVCADALNAAAPQAPSGQQAEPTPITEKDVHEAWCRGLNASPQGQAEAIKRAWEGGKALGLALARQQSERPAPAGQAVGAIPLLAEKHQGMRVDYSGLLGQCQRGLRNAGGHAANAEMLRQLQEHLKELGQRWYAGDTAVVDEILQLYCIEKEARAALAASQAERPAVKEDK